MAFVAIYLLYQIGGWLALPALGELTTLVLGWVTIAVPVLVIVRLRGLTPREALRLRAPSARAWVGTVFFAGGMIGAAALYMTVQNAVFGHLEFYAAQQKQWRETLASQSLPEFALLILAVGVTPAVCEELLFRGLLLRSFAPVMGRAQVCVVVGVLFGLFHGLLSLQMIPAALLGMGITWLALATDSLWTAVLFHLIFNTATITMHHIATRLGVTEVGPLTEFGLPAALTIVLTPLSLLFLRPPRAAEATVPSPRAAGRATTETVTGVQP